MREAPRCPLCGEERAVPRYSVPDRLQPDGPRYTLLLCTGCGLAFLAHPADDNAFYPVAYPPHGTVPSRRGIYGTVRGRLKRRTLADHKGYPWTGSATHLMRFLTRCALPFTGQVPRWRAQGRLLDVGCGGGTYLRAMRDLGWEVYGIEPQVSAARQARIASGASIWAQPPEEADLPARTFHVVTLWHTLEHMQQPVEALQALQRALVPEGVLMLEVPNYAGPGRRLFSEHWIHLDLPRHALALTPATLARLLALGGFRVTSIKPIGNSLGIAGSLRLRWPRLRWLQRAPSSAFSALISAALARVGWGECLRATAVPTL